MKIWTKFLAGMILAGCLCLPTVVLSEDNYETDSYAVDVNVHKDQSYDIKETIGVDFPFWGYGISRYIPYKGFMETSSGENLAYKASIENIQTGKDSYQVSDSKNQKIIKLDSSSKMQKGKHTYRISYRYRMYNEDENNGLDEFYLNVIPDGWKSDIKSANVVIHMPKDFDGSQVEIFSGDYRDADAVKGSYTVAGRTIRIATSGILKKGSGITVRVVLPENYFTGVANNHAEIDMAVLAGLTSFFAMIFLWFRYGREYSYKIKRRKEPPQGLLPAQLGYILRGRADRKDLISMVIYYAGKGYLSIEEKAVDGKKDFIFHKKKNLDHHTSSYEKIFFDGLFKGNSNVSLSQLGYEFEQTCKQAQNAVDQSLQDENGIGVFEDHSVIMSIVMGIVLFAAFCIGGFASAFIYGSWDNGFVAVFPAVLFILALVLLAYLERKEDVISQSACTAIGIVSVVLIMAAVLLTSICFSVMTSNGVIGCIYCAAGLAACRLIRSMNRRTRRGTAFLEEILGLEEFFKEADVAKLSAMQEENPDYFYHMLPYAYALDVPGHWFDQFRTIPVEKPDWFDDTHKDCFVMMPFVSRLEAL